MGTISRFFISLFFFVMLAMLACNGPTELGIKNPREYTWTVDTLAYPGSIQTLMYDIWGSSPQDVYAVGDNDRAFGRMWHYDGSKWTSVKLHVSEGGPFTNIAALRSIQGFGTNTIFVAGEKIYQNPTPPPNFLDSSLVLSYSEVAWQEISFERQRLFQTVWGRSPSDLWFGGINGTLFHYNGNMMSKDTVPVFIPKDADPVYNFISIAGSQNGETYMILYADNTPEGETKYWIMEHQGAEWAVIDSNFYLGRELWVSPSGSLYAVGFGAHRRMGNSWQNLHLDDISAADITGTSDDNIFVAGSVFQDNTFYGSIYHYNGSNWHKFTNLNLPNLILNAVWTNGKEVFAVGYTFGVFPQVSIVVHGK